MGRNRPSCTGNSPRNGNLSAQRPSRLADSKSALRSPARREVMLVDGSSKSGIDRTHHARRSQALPSSRSRTPRSGNPARIPPRLAAKQGLSIWCGTYARATYCSNVITSTAVIDTLRDRLDSKYIGQPEMDNDPSGNLSPIIASRLAEVNVSQSSTGRPNRSAMSLYGTAATLVLSIVRSHLADRKHEFPEDAPRLTDESCSRSAPFRPASPVHLMTPVLCL